MRIFIAALLLPILLMVMANSAFAALRAEYRFDEAAWNGTANEVIESVSAENGSVVGTATTTSSGVLCRAGDFSDSTNTDRVNIPNTVVDGLSSFSVATWARTTSTQSQTIISGANSGSNNEFLLFFSNSTTMRPYITGSSGGVSIPNIADGNWHHYVWTRSGTQNCLYVDGALEGCVTLPIGAVNIDANGLVIGQEQDSVNGNFTSGQDWDGDLDELLIFDNTLNATEVADIYNNQSAGDNWDGSGRVCADSATAPIAEFNFDELSWDGTSGEVADNTGGGLDGNAVGAIPTMDGQICGAGTFDGSDDYINVSGIDTYLGTTSSLSFWIKTSQSGNNTSWQAPGISGIEQGGGSDDVFWGWIDASGDMGISAGNAAAAKSSAINNDAWRHIVLTRDSVSGEVNVYVDGALVDTATGPTGDIGNTFSSIGRIEDTGGSPVYFSGDLDELLVFDQVVSAIDVQIIYANQSAGFNWNGTIRSCPLPPIPPVAEFRFDESEWDGTSEEVIETISGANGTAEGTATTKTDGVVCRAGDFTNSTNVDRVNLPSTIVDGMTDFTVSAWGKTTSSQQQTIISGANASSNNEFLMFYPNATRFQPFISSGSSSMTVSNVSDGNWHHHVWTRTGSQNCFYLDGVFQNCVALSTAAVDIDSNGLVIGQEQDSVNGGFTSSQDWDGDLDEVLIFNSAISTTQITDIYNNQLAGNNYDGSARLCDGELPTPVAEFRLDEFSWNGSSNEVEDTTGGGLDGTANGATTIETGQICRAGNFDGTNDYIDVNGIDAYLGTTSSLSFWIKTTQTGNNTSWRAPGISGVEQSGGSDDVFWGWLDASGDIGISAGNAGPAKSTSDISDDAWHHIILTRNSATGAVNVYVDGVLEDSANSQAGDIGNSFSSLGRIEDTGGSPEYFGGELDEILIFDQILNAAEAQEIFNNQSAGNNYDGTARVCPDVVPAPIAEYRFDETIWDGTVGEVLDSSFSSFDGNALETDNDVSNVEDGKVCRAGSFPDIADDNLNHAVATTIDIDGDVGAQGSISLWYRSDHDWGSDSNDRTLWDASSAGSDNKYFYLILRADGSLRYGAEDSADGDYRINSAPQAITAGQWMNIVVTWDVNGTDQGDIWLNGVELTTSTFNDSMNAAALGNTYTLYVGDNRSTYFPSGSNRSANGDIDEVLVFDSVLTTPQIDDLITKHNAGQNLDGSARTCPVSGPDHFDIDHNSTAIYCLATPVTVTAEDAANNTLTTFTGTITIDTNSGIGDWSVTTGNGSFDNATANDGIATYTFDASDNGEVVFSLDHSDTDVTTPVSLDILVTNGSVTDDNLEGTLDFSASGFTLTGAELTNPASPVAVANGQFAAKDFDLHIAAYGQTPTDPVCGVIEAYDGSRNLTFAVNYVEPSSGILSPTIDGSSIASPINISFTSGQAIVAANYADAGRINISATESGLTGNTNNFVVKPAGICVEAITANSECASANPNDGSCNAFVAAGADFTVRVSGKAWEVDGESNAEFCTGNLTTPNFNLVTNLNRVLVAPAGGEEGVYSDNSAVITSNGTVDVTQTISEVGVFTLATPELSYLGETILASTSANIGRFIPDHFRIVPASTPLVLDDSCGGSSAFFHYLGQLFTACYDIQAVTVDGTTITTNYDGDFNKLDVGSNDVTYGVADLTDSYSFSNNSRVTVGSTSVSWIDGEAAVSTGLQIDRLTVADGPFTNTHVGVAATDSDGVITQTFNLDADLDATNDHIDLGTLPGELRYGRAFFAPVHGPEIPLGEELSIPFIIEYWDGTNFITNTDDDSSAYDTWSLSCSDGSISCGSITLNEADVTATTTGGKSDPADPVGVTRPGISGDVTIEIEVDDWLKFDWSGLGDEDPTSLVTFGSYRGNDRIIYWREVSN